MRGLRSPGSGVDGVKGSSGTRLVGSYWSNYTWTETSQAGPSIGPLFHRGWGTGSSFVTLQQGGSESDRKDRDPNHRYPWEHLVDSVPKEPQTSFVSTRYLRGPRETGKG